MSFTRSELRNVQAVMDEYGSYLNLAANENSMSQTARQYLPTVASDRYYFQANCEEYSDFPEFVASGNSAFDALIAETKHTLGEMFNSEYVNLNPLSGIHAMLMVLLSFTDAGETVASLSPQAHGHFSTAAVVGRIGRKSVFLPITGGGSIDKDALREFIHEHSPRMIYIDAMSYQHPFDIQSIRDAVGEEVLIVFDASHTLGLIAGDAFPDPFESGADVVCGNTHKTFPGPHRGLILVKKQSLGDVLDKNGSNLYSTVQGGTLIALAVTVAEMQIYIRKYAADIIKNAQALQVSLVHEEFILADVPLTENHQVHITRTDRGSAIELMKKLKNQGILTHVCYGSTEGFYVRIGTQEITRRGMGEQEMGQIAALVRRIDRGQDCRLDVIELNKRFNNIYYSFDEGSSRNEEH